MNKDKTSIPLKKSTSKNSRLTKRQQEIFDYILKFTSEAGYPPTVRDIAKGVGLSSSSTVHFHLNAIEEKGFIQRDPSKPRALKTYLNADNKDHKGCHKKSAETASALEADKMKDPVSKNETCSCQKEMEYSEEKEEAEEMKGNFNSKDLPKDHIEEACNNTIKIESAPEEISKQVFEAASIKEMDDTEAKEEDEPLEDSLSPIKYLGCEIAPFPIVSNGIQENPSDDNNLCSGFLPLPLSLTNGKEGFIMNMEGDSMSGIGINHGDLCFFQKTETFNNGDISALYANGQLTVKKIYGHMGLYRLEPENRRMNPVYVKDVKVLGKLAGVIKTYL